MSYMGLIQSRILVFVVRFLSPDLWSKWSNNFRRESSYRCNKQTAQWTGWPSFLSIQATIPVLCLVFTLVLSQPYALRHISNRCPNCRWNIISMLVWYEKNIYCLLLKLMFFSVFIDRYILHPLFSDNKLYLAFRQRKWQCALFEYQYCSVPYVIFNALSLLLMNQQRMTISTL